jgi:hypothetical protein
MAPANAQRTGGGEHKQDDPRGSGGCGMLHRPPELFASSPVAWNTVKPFCPLGVHHTVGMLPAPTRNGFLLTMAEAKLFLISANKSRVGNLDWGQDDYDVRDGSPEGSVIGRIYKMVHSPSGTPWFWSVLLLPARANDSGTEATREDAMAAFKEQWIARRRWEHLWITRP